MSKRSSNIPTLTSIRGIAAWWVVAYHFRDHVPSGSLSFLRIAFAQGYLAVDLFFVLSGFVIFLNYADSFGRIGRDATQGFLAKRIARIYPLHLTTLLLFLLIPLAVRFFSHTGQLGSRYDPTYFILSLFLVQNWGFARSLAWNIPAWSISTEWFAYLSFPLFAGLILRYAKRISVTIAVLVISLAALAVTFWLGGEPSIGDGIPDFGLPRCVFEFWAGGCICHLYRRYEFTSTAWPLGLLAGASLLLAAGVTLTIPTYVVVPTALCLLILGLALPNNPLKSIFETQPLLYLGEISYSTYMIHYFIRDWTKFLFVNSRGPELLPTLFYVAATLIASICLYHAVETPGRRLLAPQRIFAAKRPMSS